MALSAATYLEKYFDCESQTFLAPSLARDLSSFHFSFLSPDRRGHHASGTAALRVQTARVGATAQT